MQKKSYCADDLLTFQVITHFSCSKSFCLSFVSSSVLSAIIFSSSWCSCLLLPSIFIPLVFVFFFCRQFHTREFSQMRPTEESLSFKESSSVVCLPSAFVLLLPLTICHSVSFLSRILFIVDLCFSFPLEVIVNDQLCLCNLSFAPPPSCNAGATPLLLHFFIFCMHFFFTSSTASKFR